MKLVFRGKSIRELEKLTSGDHNSILKKLSLFLRSVEPLAFAEKLTDFKFGSYRFRIGEFRVAFDVEGDTIVVLKIGNRKDVYR
jgi:mRNA interferase RelE/StbE